MTIASTDSKISYAGNGSTTVFAVPFYFLANDDLRVVLVDALGTETNQTYTTHYTLTGAGDPDGGSLTMVTAPASGKTLVVLRSPAIVQEVDYVENSAFPAETHEAALDLLTMICQSLQEQVDRAVLYPVSTAAEDVLGSREFLAATTANAATATTQAGIATTQAGLAAGYASDASDSADAAAQSAIEAADVVSSGIPDATTSVKGKVLLAANGGTTAATVVQGNDSRLSNARPCDNTFADAAIARINLGITDTFLAPAKKLAYWLK